MNPEDVMDRPDVKKSIREQAHANRQAQENKDELSRDDLRDSSPPCRSSPRPGA